MQPSDTSAVLHATALAYGPNGVLLLGPPGSGKSDLALRALVAGAIAAFGVPAPRLVADDAVLTSAGTGKLVLTCSPTIHGQIEVRGLGPIAVLQDHVVPCGMAVPAALAIQLQSSPPERLPDPEWVAVHGVHVPLVRVQPFAASAVLHLALAVKLWALRADPGSAAPPECMPPP